MLLSKGRGVRKTDVIDAFYALVSDPQAGLPATLYLDNGGEYNAIADAFHDFPDLKSITSGRGVVKAKPYNGAAKGLIEGAFGNIERLAIQHLPGAIGSDRMRKKTQNVGVAPLAFTGTADELVERLRECVAIYNDRPQHGRLGGISPRTALAEARQKWAATGVDNATFDFVFSDRQSRDVCQGKFDFRGTSYVCDAVAKLGWSDKLEIRAPLRAGATGVAVARGGQFLGVAYPQIRYHPLDPAGIAELERRRALQREGLRELRQGSDPSIDIHAESVRFTDATPVATEFGAIVSIADPAVPTNIRPDPEEVRAHRDLSRVIADYRKREASGGTR